MLKKVLFSFLLALLSVTAFSQYHQPIVVPVGSSSQVPSYPYFMVRTMFYLPKVMTTPLQRPSLLFKGVDTIGASVWCIGDNKEYHYAGGDTWIPDGGAGSGMLSFETIEDMQNYIGVGTQAIVTDTLRGGLFVMGSGVANGGTIFSSVIHPGLTWMRQGGQGQSVNVTWWKPYVFRDTIWWDSAYNSAIQYLHLKYNKGDIFVPPMTYLTRQPIFPQDSIHIHGVGRASLIWNTYKGLSSGFYGDVISCGWFQQLDLGDSNVVTHVVTHKARMYDFLSAPAGQDYIIMDQDSTFDHFSINDVVFVRKGAFPLPSGPGTVDSVGEPSVSIYLQLRKIDSMSRATKRIYFSVPLDDSVWKQPGTIDTNYRLQITKLQGGHANQASEYPSYIAQGVKIDNVQLRSEASSGLATRPACYECEFRDIYISKTVYLLGSNGNNRTIWDNVSGYYRARACESAEGAAYNLFTNFWAGKILPDANGGQAQASGISAVPVITSNVGDIFSNFYVFNEKTIEGVCVNARRRSVFRDGMFYGMNTQFIAVRGDEVTVDNVKFYNTNDTILVAIIKTTTANRLSDTVPLFLRSDNLTITNNKFFTKGDASKTNFIGYMFMNNSTFANNHIQCGPSFPTNAFVLNGVHNSIYNNSTTDSTHLRWNFFPANLGPSNPSYIASDILNDNFFNVNSTGSSSMPVPINMIKDTILFGINSMMVNQTATNSSKWGFNTTNPIYTFDFAGLSRFRDHMAIGAGNAPDAQRILDVAEIIAPNGATYGMFLQPTIQMSANSTSTHRGAKINLITNSGGFDNLVNPGGIALEVVNDWNSTGHAAQMVGGQFVVNNNGAGTLDLAVAAKILANTNSGGGSLQGSAGLIINNLAAGTNNTMLAIGYNNGIRTGNWSFDNHGIYPSTFDSAIGINTATIDGSALLDVRSSSKGVVFPRMTSTNRDAITAIAGLLLYNTTSNRYNYYNGTSWVSFGQLAGSASLNFPDTSPQTFSSLTIAVTGAAVGDPVSVGTDLTLDSGTMYSAQVTATDVVTVYFNNYSAGNVNPVTGTFNIRVFK